MGQGGGVNGSIVLFTELVVSFHPRAQWPVGRSDPAPQHLDPSRVLGASPRQDVQTPIATPAIRSEARYDP